MGKQRWFNGVNVFWYLQFLNGKALPANNGHQPTKAQNSGIRQMAARSPNRDWWLRNKRVPDRRTKKSPFHENTPLVFQFLHKRDGGSSECEVSSSFCSREAHVFPGDFRNDVIIEMIEEGGGSRSNYRNSIRYPIISVYFRPTFLSIIENVPFRTRIRLYLTFHFMICA